MTFNSNGHLKGYREAFIYLMVLSIIALCLPGRMTENLDHRLARILGPFYLQTYRVSQSISQHIRNDGPSTVSPRDWRAMNTLNQALQIENANLRQELADQKIMLARLSGVRQALRLERMNLVNAAVIGTNSDAGSRVLLLDHGHRDGVRPGQYALGSTYWRLTDEEASNLSANHETDSPHIYDHAAVGKIYSSGQRTSKLQLISDPTFRVPVVIQPAEARTESFKALGMLIGQGMQPPIITMISSNYDIQPEDPVFVRSAPDTLPVRVLAGFVQSAKRDEKNPVMLNITMRPGVKLDELNQVVVVTPVQESHREETP